jgi:hypothetical protein
MEIYGIWGVFIPHNEFLWKLVNPNSTGQSAFENRRTCYSVFKLRSLVSCQNPLNHQSIDSWKWRIRQTWDSQPVTSSTVPYLNSLLAASFTRWHRKASWAHRCHGSDVQIPQTGHMRKFLALVKTNCFLFIPLGGATKERLKARSN